MHLRPLLSLQLCGLLLLLLLRKQHDLDLPVTAMAIVLLLHEVFIGFASRGDHSLRSRLDC